MSASLRERAEGILSRLVAASATERLFISLAALVTSILVGAVLILVSGWFATCSAPLLTIGGVGTFCYDPVRVYKYLFVGAVADPRAFSLVPLNLALNPFNVARLLKETTILVFTGLSVAVAFRAGMFNIGTQGQMVLGALGTGLSVLWVAPFVPAGLLGGLILVPVGLVVGAVAGGIYGAIPGALKAYADANEVITTIMLNFIAANLAFVLVKQVFQDPSTQAVRTRPLPDYALLDPILSLFPSGANFSIIALGGAIALIIGLYYLLNATSFGYDLRVSGLQPSAAEYGGVNAARTMVSSMGLSGALGGLGGAVLVLMVNGYFQTGIPSYGFDGITVSILAGNSPVGVLFAAGLFGILKSGSIAIEFGTQVPGELVDVLRGLIILFVAMPEFFRMLGKRLGIESDETEATPQGGEAS